MKAVRCLCIAMTVLCGPASAQSAPQAPAAPNAPRQEHVVEWHGERVQDPWFWLREKDSLPVLDYLKAENAYTQAMTSSLAPFVDALYKEMLGHIQQTDLESRCGAGRGSITSRAVEGNNTPSAAVSKQGRTGFNDKAAEQILLDQNEMAKRDQVVFSFGDSWPPTRASAGLHHRQDRFPPISL